MPSGAPPSVQYYAAADDNHFVHVVTKENLVKNNSYVNHVGLNGNPNAKFQFFQNASPNVRGGQVNKDDVVFTYDKTAGQWFLATAASARYWTMRRATIFPLPLIWSFSTMPAVNAVPLTMTPVTRLLPRALPLLLPRRVPARPWPKWPGPIAYCYPSWELRRGNLPERCRGIRPEVDGFDLAVNSQTSVNGNSGQADQYPSIFSPSSFERRAMMAAFNSSKP